MQQKPLLEEGTVLRGRKRHKTKYKASKHQQMLQNSNPVRLKHQRSIQNSMAKSSPKVEKNNTEILRKIIQNVTPMWLWGGLGRVLEPHARYHLPRKAHGSSPHLFFMDFGPAWEDLRRHRGDLDTLLGATGPTKRPPNRKTMKKRCPEGDS